MSLLLGGIGAVVAYSVFRYFWSLRHSINGAKRSGLPYVVAPWQRDWQPWQVTHKLWLPIIKSFPKSWWEGWLDAVIPNFAYNCRHEWYARLGDAFIVVSPFNLRLTTANAQMIRTITLKRDKFVKRSRSYDILRLFGENVITAEGAVWRMHRKVTAPSFSERNAALVFREAICQTQGMLRTWTGPVGGTRSEPLTSLQHDTLKLALNVISYVGFGLRLLWPGETLPPGTDPKLVKYGSLESPAGHKMSFSSTMETVLEYLLLLLLVPMWILRLVPLEWARQAVTSYDEYIKYMDELLDEKVEEARSGNHAEEGMDLMGQLAKSTYGQDNKDTAVLSRQEILGNAFIMFVAGHETTANAIHFTLIQLATHPDAQRKLQRDIDNVLGDADPSQWDYDQLVNPMTASMIGACMYETLRLFPPVVEVPKEVWSEADETLAMDGTRYVIPKGTDVSLAIAAAHVNPRYWPTQPSKIRAGESDMLDYVPERWFQTQTKAKESGKDGEGSDVDSEDFGGFVGPDTNAQLFRPENGAYVPFSYGARSCLGRRVAVVKIIAALAVIFRSYSLELAVDEWASPEQVEQMGREERAQIYRWAQEKSRRTIDEATTLLTLKLLGGRHVPVRVVRRGEEKFVDWMD